MSDTTPFKIGTPVAWDQADSDAIGTVAEVFTKPVTIDIGGVLASESSSDTNPAYLITMNGNQRTLKAHSDLEVVS